MVDYIKSELFRAVKYKGLRIFLGLTALMVALVVVVGGLKDLFNSPDTTTMFFWGVMSLIGAGMLYSLALVFTFKTKDTKVQILSYGISRWKMYLWDFISFQIITIACVIIMAILALVGTKLGEITGLLQYPGDYGLFIEQVKALLILGINLSASFFGLAFLLDNVSLGIATPMVFIPITLQLLMAFTGKNVALQDKIIQFMGIQQWQLAQSYMEPHNINWTIVLYGFIYTLLAFVITGLVRYSKQEIY